MTRESDDAKRERSTSDLRYSTQHDEPGSGSQESYATSASGRTHGSMPPLAKFGSTPSRTISRTPSPRSQLSQNSPGLFHLTSKVLPLSSPQPHVQTYDKLVREVPKTPPESVERGTRLARDETSSFTNTYISPSRGIKRAANGTAKLLSSSSDHFNIVGGEQHLTPRRRHVREQAYKLQARLQLAMTKVKHGWEFMSPSEFNNLRSGHTSPVKTVSPTLGLLSHPSPWTAASGCQHSRMMSHGTIDTSAAGDLSVDFRAPYHRYTRSQPNQGFLATARPNFTELTDDHIAPSLEPSPDFCPAADINFHAGQQSEHQHWIAQAKYKPRRMTTPTPQEQVALDSLMLIGSPTRAHFTRTQHKYP